MPCPLSPLPPPQLFIFYFFKNQFNQHKSNTLMIRGKQQDRPLWPHITGPLPTEQLITSWVSVWSADGAIGCFPWDLPPAVTPCQWVIPLQLEHACKKRHRGYVHPDVFHFLHGSSEARGALDWGLAADGLAMASTADSKFLSRSLRSGSELPPCAQSLSV